jgi:uncharacterized protein YxjI
MIEIETIDKFLLNQKFMSLDSKYFVYDEGGRQLFYVDRPVLQMNIDMGIYDDESKRHRLYSLKTKSFLEYPFRHFFFYDADDKLLAVYMKNQLLGMIRGVWEIYADEAKTDMIGRAEEDSWGKALFRRFGPLGEFLKTDFHIYQGETQMGSFIRKITIGDKYVMDLTLDAQRKFDRRVALGLSLVLDIGEGR